MSSSLSGVRWGIIAHPGKRWLLWKSQHVNAKHTVSFCTYQWEYWNMYPHVLKHRPLILHGLRICTPFWVWTRKKDLEGSWFSRSEDYKSPFRGAGPKPTSCSDSMHPKSDPHTSWYGQTSAQLLGAVERRVLFLCILTRKQYGSVKDVVRHLSEKLKLCTWIWAYVASLLIFVNNQIENIRY